MFKIPDWGEDVPKSNIDVDKLFPSKHKSKLKQSKGAQNTGHLKNNTKNRGKSIPNGTGRITKIKNVKQPKYTAKKFQNISPKVKSAIKKTENKPTPSCNIIDIQNCDTDKLDEVILDAKKKNLIDSYKKDDNEEELFTEKVEKSFERVKKSKIINDNQLSRGKQQTKLKRNERKLKKQVTQSKVPSENNIEIIKVQNTFNNSAENIKYKNVRKKNKNGGVSTEIPLSKNTKNKDNEDERLQGNNNIVKITNVSNASTDNTKGIKNDRKKGLLKNMLQSHRTPINVSGNKLRERMLEKLNAAKFRFLNEKLYTSSGSEAQKLFQEDPTAFQTYHQGYQQQVKKWPVNPLDVVVKRIKNLPKTHLIADLGCGEAALSKRVTQNVRSFDLVATAPGVEVCDMAHTPLLSASMDVAVYCLALMGTDLTQYLVEANRILKMGGHLLIAEVESRFDDVDSFTKEVQKLGFTLRKLDKTHKVFYFMEFTKTREPPVKKSKLPSLYLKPCIYKRR
ncbi:ribosomal RNA-processing protein 8 [Aricia agestis]|uniref:ribosomal RNA-processing protein 8 n=1 Tax=Aricia agestis TaxID=91739 RepID=UPI001C20A33F|nr:ribosomal RNA-processing protein 8 [Aricia agestis]